MFVGSKLPLLLLIGAEVIHDVSGQERRDENKPKFGPPEQMQRSVEHPHSGIRQQQVSKK